MRVVNKSKPDGIFGHDVGVQAALLGRPFFRMDPDKASNNRSDAVSADDQIVRGNKPILKGDGVF